MNFIRTGEKSNRRKRKMDPEAVPVRTVAVIPEVLPDMPEDPVPAVSWDIPVAQVP